MIRVDNVSKTFRKQMVVQDVSLSVEKGTVAGIVGRNGSGKTVLFKMICGLMHPTLGRIVVNNQIVGQDVDFPQDIGVIIETPGFIGWKTGMQNLRDIALLNNKLTKKEIREVMQRVGLDPDNNNKVAKYSLGMRQRLGIAQAIMEKPKILILDEPMNGLDRQGVEEIRSLLLEMKKNRTTILIASHNQEDIDVLCDVVYHMDCGVLKEGKIC